MKKTNEHFRKKVSFVRCLCVRVRVFKRSKSTFRLFNGTIKTKNQRKEIRDTECPIWRNRRRTTTTVYNITRRVRLYVNFVSSDVFIFGFFFRRKSLLHARIVFLITALVQYHNNETMRYFRMSLTCWPVYPFPDCDRLGSPAGRQKNVKNYLSSSQ